MDLLCTDVGPVHPVDFSRTRQCLRPEAVPATVVGPAATATEGPPAVEHNLTTLTHAVPMAEIEDLPPSMHPHVVGMPWTWVQLFQCLENIIVHYGRANRPRA